MELRLGRVRQGHGRSWKRRAFTKNLREVGDVLFLRKVVPVWYPSIGARGRNTLPIARQTTRRPAVFAIPGLPHLAIFSVGIDGSVIHNSLLKQLVTGHGSFGDHDSSVIPSSESGPVASGLAPPPATEPCPCRMTHQRAPQNPSDRNPLYRKAFNSNYTWDRNPELLGGCCFLGSYVPAQNERQLTRLCLLLRYSLVRRFESPHPGNATSEGLHARAARMRDTLIKRKVLTHKERREEKWQDQDHMAATHSGMEFIGWRITSMAGRASEQEWIWGKTTTSESTIPGTKVRHLSQSI